MGRKLFYLDDFEKDVDLAVRDFATEIGEKIKMAYVNSIDYFYNQYEPSSYKRTWNLETSYIGVGGKKKYKRNYKRKNYYLCGIFVGDEYISGEPYLKRYGRQMYKSEVFERSWLKGIHGFNITDVRSANKGMTKEQYKYRWNPKTIPETTRPAPAINFKKDFRSITDRASIRKQLLEKVGFGINYV